MVIHRTARLSIVHLSLPDFHWHTITRLLLLFTAAVSLLLDFLFFSLCQSFVNDEPFLIIVKSVVLHGISLEVIQYLIGVLGGTRCLSGCLVCHFADRPYRKAMSTFQAIQILLEGRGTQWDPQVVNAFVDMIIAEKEQNAAQPRSLSGMSSASTQDALTSFQAFTGL